MKITDIKPYAKNAKLHPAKQLAQLAAIVAEVGWRQPVLVNQQGVIVAGHGRWMTWQKHKDKLKPIWIIDDKGNTIHGAPEKTPLTSEQEIAYRLADNKLNESDWDMDLVKEDGRTLTQEMWELTGFDNDLLIEDNENDDIVPQNAPSRAKMGDVWQMGKHRMLVGDATLEDAYMKLIGRGIYADCVFTDPPYNVNYKGQGKKTSNKILNDSMSPEDFDRFLFSIFLRWPDVIKKGAGVYVFHSTSTQAAFQAALNATGFEIKNQLVWNKPMAALGWGDYRWKHEPFFYAGQKGAAIRFYGDRTHATVVDFTKDDTALANWAKRQKQAEKEGKMTIWTMKREPVQDYVHPTQKPVELITYALFNSTKEGDIVLDPFLGSGSTLIAAEKTGRICFGMELDPKYADTVIERWENYTNKKAKKE